MSMAPLAMDSVHEYDLGWGLSDPTVLKKQ